MTAKTPIVTLQDIQAAALRIKGGVDNTPCLYSETLSEIVGADLFLKFENLQFTASFKERGALNRLACLTAEERARGVLAVSAGNHAQGVAYHARKLGIKATIIMPTSTPGVKVKRTRDFGAEVILHGATFTEANAYAPELMRERGLTFIPPYDDPAVIAGQGTIGLELLDAVPDLDTVVIAIGGGGLIAGVGTVIKSLKPGIEVIGVQSAYYPSMAHYLGRWDEKARGGTSIAEGIAVIEPGQITREIARDVVDDVIVVPETVIEEAICLLLQIEKTLTEGAGAAGLAAVLMNRDRFKGKRVGLVLCGGNIDTRMLTAILQRQLVREKRLLRLRALLPDQRGALGAVCSLIGANGGNINTVTHDRTFLAANAKSARVDIELELQDPAQALAIGQALANEGVAYEWLQGGEAS